MTDHLYLRYGTNDLRKNKGVNIALAVVLILSAFLMATGSMVMERLVGSINQLFEQAKPPHFLQMHKGEYDEAALAAFAAQHPEIDGWLVEEMLGFDSSALTWRRDATGESGSLSASLIDNLFVTQNDGFDLLIDLDGGVPDPGAGQVYVPVAYQQEFALQPGDELTVRTNDGDGGAVHVNAHGTGTVKNDLVEALVLERALGDRALVTSTKSMTGHLGGAAGAVEAVATVLALRRSTVPPTVGTDTLDAGVHVDVVLGTAREASFAQAASLSMGFGGHNAALVFRLP